MPLETSKSKSGLWWLLCMRSFKPRLIFTGQFLNAPSGKSDSRTANFVRKLSCLFTCAGTICLILYKGYYWNRDTLNIEGIK